MRGDCQIQVMKVKSLNKNKGDDQNVFITIDDLLQQAQDLVIGMKILSDYKYPLEVRKGSRKEVYAMENGQDGPSRMIKAGKKTYFFDIKKTKDNKPYLLISETWFKDEDDQQPERSHVIVFPEQAKDFAFASVTMLDKILEE